MTQTCSRYCRTAEKLPVKLTVVVPVATRRVRVPDIEFPESVPAL